MKASGVNIPPTMKENSLCVILEHVRSTEPKIKQALVCLDIRISIHAYNVYSTIRNQILTPCFVLYIIDRNERPRSDGEVKGTVGEFPSSQENSISWLICCLEIDNNQELNSIDIENDIDIDTDTDIDMI